MAEEEEPESARDAHDMLESWGWELGQWVCGICG